MAGIDNIVTALDNKYADNKNLWAQVRQKYEVYKKAFDRANDKNSGLLANPFTKPDITSVRDTLDVKLRIMSIPSIEQENAKEIADNARIEIENAIQALWNKELAIAYKDSISNNPETRKVAITETAKASVTNNPSIWWYVSNKRLEEGMRANGL